MNKEKECYWSNRDFGTRICTIKLIPVTQEECKNCEMYKED